MSKRQTRRGRKRYKTNLEKSNEYYINTWVNSIMSNNETATKYWQARSSLEDFTALEEIHENW